MGQLIQARCGFTTEPASFLAYPALRCEAYAVLESATADFVAEPVMGKVASAVFETDMCDTAYGPGGFIGALAWTDEPASPFAFESSADAAEPLGQHLNTLDLLLALRADVAALHQAFERAPAYDPGDLTIPFTSNL
jgi:hypothetical protein